MTIEQYPSIWLVWELLITYCCPRAGQLHVHGGYSFLTNARIPSVCGQSVWQALSVTAS